MILSFLYTVLSTVLSLVIAFSNAGVAAEKPGTPAWNAGARKTFGPALMPRYDVTFDEVFTQAFGRLAEESGLDLPGIAAGLPDFFYGQRWMARLFPGLFAGQRDRWLADEKGWAIFGIVLGMPQSMRLKAEPTGGNPDEYRVLLEMTFPDGSVTDYDTQCIFNTETGDLSSRKGIFNLGFNLNLKEMWGYTAEDPPQRSLGYCKLYDDLLLQTRAVNAATVRLKFPYQGKDWMLQLWKGRYFTTSGGEIGLYHKPKNRLLAFYDTASSERIGMSFEVYVKETGQPLVVRPVENHWWMTGFALNRYVYLADRLTLKTEIVPADADMLRGLVSALDKEAARGVLSYTVSEDETRLVIQW